MKAGIGVVPTATPPACGATMAYGRHDAGSPSEERRYVSAFTLSHLPRWRPAISRSWALGGLPSALLLVLIGVELAVLVAWLPDTFMLWWSADEPNDFAAFYGYAKELSPAGLYSPRLSLLLHPLTYLDLPNAYRAYTTLAVLALLATAYLAQRGIGSWEGRLAVVLGVLSIPQMHWALRIGHLTPFLALAALSGFLLLRRHPILAGLCFALLTIKPQYAVIPGLYLLWTRNGRALAAMLAAVAAMELVAFAAAGFDTISSYMSTVFDWGVDTRDDRFAFKTWQYSWPGFLISAGFQPNPLVIFDLIVLSLAAIVLVWMRGGQSLALPAAALGMLLVTPYANFYDWGILVVAGALLLRAQVPWKRLLPAVTIGLYFTLIVTQTATNFPAIDVELGGVGPAGEFLPALYGDFSPALGVYWITPVALAVVFLLALLGRRDEVAQPEAISRPRPRLALAFATALSASRAFVRAIFGLRPSLAGATALSAPPALVRAVSHRRLRLALVGALLPLGYFAAAFIGNIPPFNEPYDPFTRAAVLRELPPDFPLPADGELQTAGQGAQLPYRVEWTTEQPVAQVAALYRLLPAGDAWDLMLEEETEPSYRVRLAHVEPNGFMSHWLMLDITPVADGSRISIEFLATRRISATLGETFESP